MRTAISILCAAMLAACARYYRGWKNFLDHYKDLVDTWVIFDNSGISPVVIGEKPLQKKHLSG